MLFGIFHFIKSVLRCEARYIICSTTIFDREAREGGHGGAREPWRDEIPSTVRPGIKSSKNTTKVGSKT